MEQLFFVKNFYHYLIILVVITSILQLFSYQDKGVKKLINSLFFLFAIFIGFYIGNRDLDIGPDTIRYEKAFLFYSDLNNFEIRKDIFYDFLTYLLSRILNFKEFLIFCAIVYIFGTFYGLKCIFKQNFYIPFLIFLISPYFVANGISAMRSGMAASLFFVALGVYYKTNNLRKTFFWMILSLLLHISMIIPLIFFLITRFVKNTKYIFYFWLISILLGALDINIVKTVVNNLGLFQDRIGDYSENIGERNYWTSFAIFGFLPVIIAVYNVLVLGYKDKFYTWLLNSYMLIHIPYIILLNSEYGLRIGYLAEFMMPILLAYPLIINPVLKIKFVNLKLVFIIFAVFLIKAYKILIL